MVSGGNGISASFEVSFTVTDPSTYGIELSETGTYVFPSAAPGYGTQSAKTITVTNTGNQSTGPLSISKYGTHADLFTVSASPIPSIAAGGKDTFTVAPAGTGLFIGTYTATIRVNSEQFNVSFTVDSTVGSPVYRVGLSETGTYYFPGAAPGYGPQSPRTITVTNTGNQATGPLTVGKSGPGGGFFTVSPPSLNSIAAGGGGSFTVVPIPGLVAGTYTATITVSNGNGINASFEVNFTVNPVFYPVTVTFDADGGAPATSSAPTFNGGTVSLPANPVKSGYTFGGWYTAKNGGGTAFTGTTPVTADLTVYARWLSTNTYLSSLSTNAGWLNFSPYTTAYTMTVPYTTTSLTVSATAADVDKASLRILLGNLVLPGNTVNLNPGENIVRVRVTAEDGNATRDYTITVTRTPLNANLGSLSVSVGTLSPAFSPNTTAYTVLVPGSTSSFTVTAAAAGAATLVQSPPNPVTLSTNSTPITLTVKAADGTTTKVYTVTVNKTTETNAVNVTIGIADERIDLTRNTENDLSPGTSLRLTAPEGYASYTWFVDGNSYGYSLVSEREIQVYSPGRYGTHSVLLRYEKDGIPYGCEVLFRFVR
jgi:uncharacterized repeat protein (TIGR02543 family)